MNIRGADIIVKLLLDQGIDRIIGIPGSATLALYDAIIDSPIEHILARHEQGAAFIAQGIARRTGKAAVCLATSGPGATNLITAIADAKADSIPLVAITGQVATSHIGTDAFQEVNTFGLTLPICKHNFLIKSMDELIQAIPKAFEIAQSGRPGPVVIDIPKDIQGMTLDHWPTLPSPADNINPDISPIDLGNFKNLLSQSSRPVILAGGGIIASEASEKLRIFARQCQIPVITTLMGIGCMDEADPLSCGMLGMHGEKYTNVILNSADLLIAIGARFDDRATGRLDEFCPGTRIIHIDIDPSEINKIRQCELAIISDAHRFLSQAINETEPMQHETWLSEINEIRYRYPPKTLTGSKHSRDLLQNIGNKLGNDTIVVTDVGQHQMWTAQSWPFSKPRTFITSGGLGTMGFGLPTAIGAALASPEHQVICISGDGSIMMNIQELATLADLNLNISIIIMNNRHLGLVRQHQQMFLNERYSGTKFKSDPDFAAIARGFGIRATRMDNPTSDMITDFIENSGPCLIDARISCCELVLPIVPAGASNIDPIEEIA